MLDKTFQIARFWGMGWLIWPTLPNILYISIHTELKRECRKVNDLLNVGFLRSSKIRRQTSSAYTSMYTIKHNIELKILVQTDRHYTLISFILEE